MTWPLTDKQKRIRCASINNKLDDMEYNLYAEDWDLGGGNESRRHLLKQLRQLGGKREPGRYGWWGLIRKWESECWIDDRDYDKLMQERSA